MGTNHDTKAIQFLRVWWHRIRGKYPTALSYLCRHIELVEILHLLVEGKGDNWDALRLVHNHEEPRLHKALPQVDGVVEGMAHDRRVALTPVPQYLVGLDRDRRRATTEIQRSRRHLAPQIVDVKDEVFVEYLSFFEDHPAKARRHQSKLVTGSVD